MLRSLKHLKGYRVHETDGEIGHVDDVYFDDHHWTVRYFVVQTGNWFQSKRVLVSPVSVVDETSDNKILIVNLTREQVRNSPGVDADKPVSRQIELRMVEHYGWPIYWPYAYGGGGMDVPSAEAAINPLEEVEDKDDPNLRSINEVIGYHIGASDGEVGHVDDFIIDDKSWIIRYIVVDTKNWLPGRRVLVAPGWVETVRWDRGKVLLALDRRTIKDSPKYDHSVPVDREYETRLHDHYGRTAYWRRDEKPDVAHRTE